MGRVPESLEKVTPFPQIAPSSQWWLQEANVLQSQPLHPLSHALQIVTNTSKEGWVTHFRVVLCQRDLVPTRKQVAYKLPGTKGGLFGTKPKRVPRPLYRQDSSHSHIQLQSSGLHKEGRGYEVGPLCALLCRILT